MNNLLQNDTRNEIAMLVADFYGDSIVVHQMEFDKFIEISQNPRFPAFKIGSIVAAMLVSQQANTVHIPDFEISAFRTVIDASKLNSSPISSAALFPQVDSQQIVVTKDNLVEKSKSADKTDLEIIFNGLAKKWKEETRGYSLTSQKYAHSAYQSILVLGQEVVPFIIRDLQTNGGRWFEALKALTKRDDITKPSDSYEDAVRAWVSYGKDNNLIS